jgi:hypothetical protein
MPRFPRATHRSARPPAVEDGTPGPEGATALSRDELLTLWFPDDGVAESWDVIDGLLQLRRLGATEVAPGR